MATAAVLIPTLTFKSWLPSGQPNALGTLQSYQAGTVTPIATYTDTTAVTQNPNPVSLNARGEANVYLLPNVGYKFIETDNLGNVIKTTDQVFNSQLLTLYGGVDTGFANAYILSFTANFSTYTDGITIYWIPAHTNTGASTINVNGLGVINITNADGSALAASAIVVNQPATILIKSGAALLVSATTTVYGSFIAGWGGFSVNPGNSTIQYRKNGTQVTLIFPQTQGTSNSTSFTMTGLPAILTPSYAGSNTPCVGFVDNNVLVPGGMATILSATNTVIFYKDGSQPLWTASGPKGFGAITSITYSL